MDKVHKAVSEIFRLYKTDNLPYMGSAPRDDRRKPDRLMLVEVLALLGFKKGVEIGVRQGAFSMLAFKHIPDLEMTCIDPWAAYHGIGQDKQDRHYRKAVENLTPFNAKILRRSSMDSLKEFEDESLDFVHIDGNHRFDYVCPDIIFWSFKLKKGGVMACHDYYPFNWAGVVKAVDAYTHCHHIDPWYITRSKTPTAFWAKP